jgi:hypothetical protein
VRPPPRTFDAAVASHISSLVSRAAPPSRTWLHQIAGGKFGDSPQRRRRDGA